ncbi:hypothetical protein BDZ89DRAFT_1042706 [Hymenopellis radicata]|nr:hypothetical protein BDZ89DRAFT_1042706 [Hymenopellis radicata]
MARFDRLVELSGLIPIYLSRILDKRKVELEEKDKIKKEAAKSRSSIGTLETRLARSSRLVTKELKPPRWRDAAEVHNGGQHGGHEQALWGSDDSHSCITAFEYMEALDNILRAVEHLSPTPPTPSHSKFSYVNEFSQHVAFVKQIEDFQHCAVGHLLMNALQRMIRTRIPHLPRHRRRLNGRKHSRKVKYNDDSYCTPAPWASSGGPYYSMNAPQPSQ